MTKDEVIELVDEQAMFYPELDGAIVGVANRCGMPTVVCYDRDKTIEILAKGFKISKKDLDADEIASGMTVKDKQYEMALEWYEFNTIGGYIGEYTPVFVTLKTE